jgi:hypothetical protein
VFPWHAVAVTATPFDERLQLTFASNASNSHRIIRCIPLRIALRIFVDAGFAAGVVVLRIAS